MRSLVVTGRLAGRVTTPSSTCADPAVAGHRFDGGHRQAGRRQPFARRPATSCQQRLVDAWQPGLAK